MIRIFKLLLGLVVVLGLSVVALGFAVLQDRPLVREMAAPTPQEVRQARHFVRGLRTAINPDAAGPSEFVTTPEDLDSLVKLGARILPGFRGHVAAAPGALSLQASQPVLGGWKWLNLAVTVPPFDRAVALSQVRLGPVEVPPALALWLGRHGGNLAFGAGFGDTVLDAASGLTIAQDRLVFAMSVDRMGSNGIMRGVFGSLRGSDLPGGDAIAGYYTRLRQAMDDGTLPVQGSYLPYLRFTVQDAQARSAVEGAENAFTSAMFALSFACGARDFHLIVGGLAETDFLKDESWRTDCADVTFNDRIDSRRHFTTAAALQAASNRGFAVSVGEFKELYDTIRAGGFDFTDIAANNSGIRMADRFMSAPVADWPALLARIEGENDVIVPFDGIPGIMREADFEAAYGDVDSPRYAAQLQDIEDRIDGIALHR